MVLTTRSTKSKRAFATLVGVSLAGWMMSGAAACRQRIRTCAEGEQTSCDCADGSQSVQVCGAEETFEPCQCGEGGARGKGNGGGGGGVDIPDFPEGAVTIDVGPDRLVDAFRQGDLIQIVTRDQIRVVTMTGQLVGSVPSSSRIRTAAFDGARLAVANDETLRIFDATLSEVFGVAALEGKCRDMEFVRDSFVLCSPGEAYDHEPFVSYDPVTAEPVTTTFVDTSSIEQDWEVGDEMHGLPGTGDVLTIYDQRTPPALELFRVASDGSVVGVGASEFNDDHPFFGVLTVLGTPPSTVVTDEGAIRTIYGDTCKPAVPWYASLCFEHETLLGQPGVNRRYYAMTADGPDAYFGVLSYDDDYSTCQQGSCIAGRVKVHRYDMALATVTAEVVIGEEVREPVRLIPDADGGGAVVVYERVAQEGEPGFPGYRAIWVPLE